jgi:hypothetical protein
MALLVSSSTEITVADTIFLKRCSFKPVSPGYKHAGYAYIF